MSLNKLSQNKDPSTGEIIPICNGANDGHCSEPADVCTHRLKNFGREGKRSAPGDPLWDEQQSSDAKLK